MNDSPISKNYEFLEEFGIDIDKLEGNSKLVFSYLVNEIDGISKMKRAIETNALMYGFLEALGCSQNVLVKFLRYQMWSSQHYLNENIELAKRIGIQIPDSTPTSDDILHDPKFAQAAAMFQSEKWQRRIWGKWATPPYE
jgi:hypothetical protein